MVKSKLHKRPEINLFSRHEQVDWKRIGLELKFSEFVENLSGDKFEKEKNQKVFNNEVRFEISKNFAKILKTSISDAP